MEKDLYDIVIVGGGPAGMTAAIYAARADKKVVLFEKNIIGGQMVNSPLVENYPGFEKISGEELGFKMQEQVEDLGVEIIFGEVVKIVDNSSEYIVCTRVDDEVYACRAKTVILANGVEHKNLVLLGKIWRIIVLFATDLFIKERTFALLETVIPPLNMRFFSQIIVRVLR